MTVRDAIKEIRQRAKAWRDQEITELRLHRDGEAYACRLRAGTLEQAADDLEMRQRAAA